MLKPGARFASYEWVSTKLFDASNPEHVRIIDEINFGNGLPVRSLSHHSCHITYGGATQYVLRVGSCYCVADDLLEAERAPFLRKLCERRMTGKHGSTKSNGGPDVWGAGQEMRSWQEAEEAGKSVGFRLVHSYDVATESRVAGPW